MDKESDIRNVWYLNVNSESGTAIGKCGAKDSAISDLDIIAGFITASQQLSREMVTSEQEISKFNLEDLQSGAKRLTMYTTWGNEVSFKSDMRDRIPIITSMLQVSGPKMSESDYNEVLRFLSLLNDEIVYRFMLGELTKERVIDPVIKIDMINNVLNLINFTKKGRLIGAKSDRIEYLVEKSLTRVLKNDANIIDIIFSKLPLEYTCIQEGYAEKVEETIKFIKNEIDQFEKAEKKLDFFRKTKIYDKKDSFSCLKESYNQFLDSQETHFENKRALAVALEDWQSILEDMLTDLQGELKNQELQIIHELKNLLPKSSALDNFIREIKNEVSEPEPLKKLTDIENKIVLNYSNLSSIINNKALNKYNQKLSKLKNGYESILSLFNILVSYKIENKLDEFFDLFKTITEKEIQYDENGNKIQLSHKDIKTEIKNILNLLRSNLVVKVINSLYDDIFNSYRKFKFVLVYSGNIKELIINKTKENLYLFINRIQDFCFAANLEKIIKRIKPDNLVKQYCIDILESYLKNYDYEYYVKNPFLREEKNFLIAFDSYSLKFCSELINETGLNKDIYREIERMKYSQKFKESFIQILDSNILTSDKAIMELKSSINLFNSWLNKVDSMINSITIQQNEITASEFINYCISFTKLTGKPESKAMKKNLYIKEVVFKNIEPKEQLKDETPESLLSKTEINRIIEELERLGESATSIFNSKEYSKLLDDSKSLLLNKLKKDKNAIEKVVRNLSNLIDTEETRKLTQLLNDIKDARELLKDNKKLKAFQDELHDIIKINVFSEFNSLLESLDNEYLNLEGYNHIKGIVKTASSSKPLIKESNIEKKYKSRELLMEALVETYAHFYEEYFGKFVFQNNGKFEIKKSDTIVKPGKLFDKVFEKTYDYLVFLNGLEVIKNLFNTVFKSQNKLKNYNIEFLMNYLSEYYEQKNYPSSEEFIKSFDAPRNAGKFLDFLINKFSDANQVQSIKTKIDNFCKDLASYCAKKSKKKPTLPQEINIFKDEIVDILTNIYNNLKEGEESYYVEGKSPVKNHPSKKYNFKKIPPKRFEEFLHSIESMPNTFNNDISSFEKFCSFKPSTITSKDIIVKKISDNLKEAIKKEVEKFNLSELVFENVNRIRIMDLLNNTEYELPKDIQTTLILKGNYNKETLKKIIDLSTKISDLLKASMTDVLNETPLFNELLNKKINAEKGGYVEYEIDIPESITLKNRTQIFGKNAIWSNDKQKIIGFKLPFETKSKNTFGDAMKSSVYLEVFNELKPIIDIINKYSREIHTGFDLVYKKLYEY